MITVLKLLTHISFLILLVIYLFTIASPTISETLGSDGTVTAAKWTGGILIVVVWGVIISALDWMKRKLTKEGSK